MVKVLRASAARGLAVASVLALAVSLVPAAAASATPLQSTVQAVNGVNEEGNSVFDEPVNPTDSAPVTPEDVQGIDPIDGIGIPDESEAPQLRNAPVPFAAGDPLPALGPQVPTLYLTGTADELTKIKGDKNYKSKGWDVELVDPQNPANYLKREDNVELKGRGNYTWCSTTNGRPNSEGKSPACNTKLPFQFKFDKKENPLGIGSAKAWILLANYTDASLMRNKLAFDFGKDIGVPFTPEGTWVDVVLNGKSIGNYLMVEKVEPGAERVKFNNLDGVIAELDNNYGKKENFWFTTGASNSTFALKDAEDGDKLIATPECKSAPNLSDECLASANTKAGWKAMKTKLAKLDGLLRSSSPNWTEIEKLIDVDSFARYYFMYDVLENPELVKSSIFFYMDGKDDKIHAGPAWDFDSAVFNYEKSEPLGGNPKAEYAKTTFMLRYSNSTSHPENPWYFDLYRNPEFVKYTNDLWDAEISAKTDKLVGNINAYERHLKESAAQNKAIFTNVYGKPTKLIAGLGHSNESNWGGNNSTVSWLRGQVEKRVTHLKRGYGNVPLIQYEASVESYGRTNPVSRGAVHNGQATGTIMKGKRLESLKVSIPKNSVAQRWSGSGKIQARGHVQDVGWQGWQSAGLGSSLRIGTEGRALRMEAFEMKLTGDLASKYNIEYRAHVQEIGWQNWVRDGATAGTSGQQKRIEAVQVRLLPKSGGVTTYENYPDVLDNHQHALEINWLADNGVSVVEKGQMFRPASKTTRGEIAQLLYNDAKRRGLTDDFVLPAQSPFPDVSTSLPNYEAIVWMAGEGITEGWEEKDGTFTFRPNLNVERNAVAVFFHRYAGKPTFQPSGKVFRDVPLDHLFFVEIDWLTSTGITQGWSDGTFRPVTNTDRSAMAAFIYRLDGYWPIVQPLTTDGAQALPEESPAAQEEEEQAAPEAVETEQEPDAPSTETQPEPVG